MQAFTLAIPSSLDDAVGATQTSGSRYIAGGTDLLQLSKDNVETPWHLIDLEPLGLNEIRTDSNGLQLGAMARMSDVAAHPDVRQRWPVLAAALLASASPQIRNMGTMGGNLLQRTRCGYFRDTGFTSCNKRQPGSGCPAIHGDNRMLAILGGSESCIATHPSDLAVALMALDATIHIRGMNGARRQLPIAEFHRLPGDTPHIETNLQPGELITAITVPLSPPAAKSTYLKVRDRASFEFALVSAAVVLAVNNGTIEEARLAAGGVGTKPWRLPEVESALRGKRLTADTLKTAANQAGEGAKTASENGFKLTLLRRAVLRALQTATA